MFFLWLNPENRVNIVATLSTKKGVNISIGWTHTKSRKFFSEKCVRKNCAHCAIGRRVRRGVVLPNFAEKVFIFLYIRSYSCYWAVLAISCV
jgi:hypothetical protein